MSQPPLRPSDRRRPSAAPDAAPPASERWPLRRKLRLALTALSILTSLGGLWLAWKWKSSPEYWKQNQTFLAQADTQTLQQDAHAVEQQALAVMDDPRPGDRIRMTFTRDQLNAWMATRFLPWLENRGYQLPPQSHDFMLSLEPGRAILAFQQETAMGQQIVSLVLDVALRADALHAHLREIRGGNLAIGSQWLVGQVRKMGDKGQAREVARLMDGATFPAVWPHPISPWLQMRLTGLDINADRAEVEITIENKPGPR